MSIWSSISGPIILALNGHDEAANYRAEGMPDIAVNVAVTTSHDHIQLGLWDYYGTGEPIDVQAVLSPEAATMLRDRLTEALERSRG